MPRTRRKAPLPLPREFYSRPATTVARDLLGKLLVRQTTAGITSGLVVEVEAYLGLSDPASHSYRGQTPRNAVMFGDPGYLYVYTIHAKFCMNAVTGRRGTPSAVLIRAVEPLAGVSIMQRRRSREALRDLSSGPAKSCQAHDVDKSLNGWDLTKGKRIWIEHDSQNDSRQLKIGRSARIGISANRDALLRFFVDGNRYVSGPKYLHSQPANQILCQRG